MEPPPAPIETTSTIGRAIKYRWTQFQNDLIVGCPSRIKHTSYDVPPISTEMKSFTPATPAVSHAPITPPAGPLASVAIGRDATDGAAAIPPEDCITSSGCLNPPSFSLSINRVRYRFTTGPIYAFTNVVEVRSNSGADGFTSYDSETISTSGYSSLMILPTRCSCSGLTKLNSSTTAIDDTPPFFRRRTCARTSFSSSSLRTLPW